MLQQLVNKAMEKFRKPKEVTPESEPKSLSLHEKIKNYAHSKYGMIVIEDTVFAIRGAKLSQDKTEIQAIPNKIDEFNDLLIVANHSRIVMILEGSVDPGLDWVKNPMNPEGCARLENGLYFYKPGTHKGKPAFNQFGKVTIRRDKNRDGIWSDSEKMESGFFGINIHWSFSRNKVGKNSAGCIIVRGNLQSPEWNKFYQNFEYRDSFAVIVLDCLEL